MTVAELIEKLTSIENKEQNVMVRLYKNIPHNCLSPVEIVYVNPAQMVELIADDLNTF